MDSSGADVSAPYRRNDGLALQRRGYIRALGRAPNLSVSGTSRINQML